MAARMTMHTLRTQEPSDSYVMYGSLTSDECLAAQNVLTGGVPDGFSPDSSLLELQGWDNVLTGPLPPSLGDASSLVTLNLGFNVLTGTVPASLSRVSRLQELTLRNNLLTGDANGNTACWTQALRQPTGLLCPAGPSRPRASCSGLSAATHAFAIADPELLPCVADQICCCYPTACPCNHPSVYHPLLLSSSIPASCPASLHSPVHLSMVNSM